MLSSQTSGLITKGLGLPADKGMITMYFTLFVSDDTLPPPPLTNYGGGGGHVPVSASSISAARYSYSPRGNSVQMRNVPLSLRKPANVPFYMPSQRTGDSKVITFKVTFGGKQQTREFVARKKSNISVKIRGLFTAFRQAIKVVVEGLFNTINKQK